MHISPCRLSCLSSSLPRHSPHPAASRFRARAERRDPLLMHHSIHPTTHANWPRWAMAPVVNSTRGSPSRPPRDVPVSEKNTPFAQARALRSSGGNCSPAPDFVLRKLIFTMCMFFHRRGVFVHRRRYGCQGAVKVYRPTGTLRF